MFLNQLFFNQAAEPTIFVDAVKSIGMVPSWASTTGTTRPASTYEQGETIMQMMGLENRAFIVTSGEVVIMQSGRPVDLIEAGEYFDESIWLGAEAVALTACVLHPVHESQPSLLQ